MKFSILALALGVSARSLTERDLATVQQVISDVGSAITALNDAVTAFSGDASGLTDASNSLIQTITDGTAKVTATDALTLQDALSLQSTVGDLTTQGQTLTDNLNSKKSAIEAAGLCSTVRDQSSQLNTGSQNLINAIVSKVPTEAQAVAGQLASGLTDVLEQNSDNFEEGSCTDAAGGGGGGASATSPTSAPTGATPTGSTPTPSAPLSTPTASQATTGAGSTPTGPNASGPTSRPTGGASGGGNGTTVVTAGAPMNAVPAAGALLLGLAALF